MKKLLLILLCLLCWPHKASATWNALVQVKSNNCGTASSCAVTVTSTGAGHLLVVAMTDPSESRTIASVTCAPNACTGGSAFVLCGTSCQTGNATTGWVDMAGLVSSVSGDTTITLNYSASATSSTAVVWEASTPNTPIVKDTGTTPTNHNLVTTNCTSCAGTSLTLSGANDAIFTIGSCGGTCSAITPYTNDLSNPQGDEVGHILNSSSGTAPTVTQSPTSNLATASMAFSEASGGGGGAVGGKAVVGGAATVN